MLVHYDYTGLLELLSLLDYNLFSYNYFNSSISLKIGIVWNKPISFKLIVILKNIPFLEVNTLFPFLKIIW